MGRFIKFDLNNYNQYVTKQKTRLTCIHYIFYIETPVYNNPKNLKTAAAKGAEKGSISISMQKPNHWFEVEL